MDKATKTSLVEAIKKGELDDWIGNHQYDLTREELATIAIETAFALFQDYEPQMTIAQRRATLATNIDQIYIVEEDE